MVLHINFYCHIIIFQLLTFWNDFQRAIFIGIWLLILSVEEFRAKLKLTQENLAKRKW